MNSTSACVLQFGLTYLAYMSLTTMRQSWAMVKNSLVDDLGITSTDLGLLDCLFLSSYSFMNFASGYVADKYPNNVLLFIADFGTGAVFLLVAWFGSVLTDIMPVFAPLFVLCGLCQGLTWTSCVKVLSVWINRNRNLMMSLWVTCFCLGNILGNSIAGIALENSWKWHQVLYIPGFISILSGVLNLLLISNRQITNSNLTQSLQEHQTTNSYCGILSNTHVLKTINIFVIFKMLYYCFLLWLPFYFIQFHGFQPNTAASLMIVFEIGTITGQILIGYLAEKYKSWNQVLTLFTFLSLVFSGGLLNSSTVPVSAFGTGLCIGGITNMIPTAMVLDIANKINPASVAKTTAIINGSGSIGTAIGQPIVGGMKDALGWDHVVSFFIFMELVNASLLTYSYVKEIYDRRDQEKEKQIS